MSAPTTRRAPDAVLATLTAVLLPLGLGVIVLGWYGAAHSPYLWEQVPYLISGGLLGLAMVTGSALLYFGSWVSRSAQSQRQSAEVMIALLREIRDQLAAAPGHVSNGHPSFVATARGSMWHRSDCSAVVGRADLRSVAPGAEGLRPCGLCDPLAVVPRPALVETS